VYDVPAINPIIVAVVPVVVCVKPPVLEVTTYELAGMPVVAGFQVIVAPGEPPYGIGELTTTTLVGALGLVPVETQPLVV
jgi:hypothetical protein